MINNYTRRLLIICYILLGNFFINAQTNLADFEDDGVGKPDANITAEWVGDPNVPIATLEANPDKTNINITNNVVKYVETIGSATGNSLQLAFSGTTVKTGHNLTNDKFVKFLVYSKNQTNFNIRLELGNGSSAHFIGEKSISTQLNTWTEVEFDFSGADTSSTINNATGWISNVRIHFNDGIAGQGDIFYVDEYTTSPTATINNDDNINTLTNIADFEDNGDGKPDANIRAEWIGDPNAPIVTLETNPNKSAINNTDNSVKFVETTGSNLNNSLQFLFDGNTATNGHFLTSENMVRFLVYSENKTNFDITLELGVGGNAHFIGQKSITTTLNTWTEVVFDFSGNDASSSIINASGKITDVRIHFNLGTPGDGSTYYVDEYATFSTTNDSGDDSNTDNLIEILTPLELNYTVSGSLLKNLNIELSTTGTNANFSLYANDKLLIHTLSLQNQGTFQFNELVKFPSTGNVTLKMVAFKNDITLVDYSFTDVTNMVYPDFTDVTEASEVVDVPSLKYGGPSIADMNQDGRYDIILNNHNDSPNKLYWNDGDGTFTKYEKDLSLWKQMDLHGSAPGDYDNDGDLDLLMSIGGGNGTNPSSNVLYRNDNGNLVRADSDVGITVNARGRSPRWVDLDMDNDLDLILINATATTNTTQPQQIFYENLGDGTFVAKRIDGLEDQQGDRIIITDYNGDHIDDILLFSPLTLWKGNGDFTFTNVTNTALPSAARNISNVLAASDIDLENDGDLDFYIARGVGYFFISEGNAADFYAEEKRLDARLSGSQGDPINFEIKAEGAITISDYDQVFRSTYTGDYPLFMGSAKTQKILEIRTETFEITPEMADGFPTDRSQNGIYIGHVGGGVWNMEVVKNQDVYWSIHFTLNGVTDFIQNGWTSSNNNKQDMLLRNDGGTFVDVSTEWNIPQGGNNWGVTRGDFNNDSFDDLLVQRFDFLKNRQTDFLLLNNGGNNFMSTTTHNANNQGTRNHGDGSQAFDYDLDGNLDVLVGDDEYGLWHLYKNSSSNSNNYIEVKVGYSPLENVDQYSAEVKVITASNTYFKRIGSAGASHSQSLLNIVHFGLGAEDTVDKIEVRWRNGESIDIFNKAANQIIDTDTELVNPTTITLTPSPLEVRVGKSEELSLSVNPVNADPSVTWSSSDTAIATVNDNGMVTGVTEGTVTITATSTANNSVVGTATVNIVAFYPIVVSSVVVTPKTATLFVGNESRLNGNVLPENADNNEITWSSSNTAIATVDNRGTVKGIADGNVTITATSTDGNHSDSATITVATFTNPSLNFDDPSIYANSVYFSGESITINTTFHAGSGNTVVSNGGQGIRYWVRHLNKDWIPQNDYSADDASVIGMESGESSATISLEGAIPTEDLPDGDFYWVWIHFTTTDGNKKIEAQLTGLKIEENTLNFEGFNVDSKFGVFPNPVIDYLTLNGEFHGEECVIYNLLGKKVFDTTLTGTENNLNLKELPKGLYFIRIDNNSISKFFKE